MQAQLTQPLQDLLLLLGLGAGSDGSDGGAGSDGRGLRLRPVGDDGGAGAGREAHGGPAVVQAQAAVGGLDAGDATYGPAQEHTEVSTFAYIYPL